jgi:NAD(P)-dependent dehydrogenase (short-subunit alcohol dehydrogenase family)
MDKHTKNGPRPAINLIYQKPINSHHLTTPFLLPPPYPIPKMKPANRTFIISGGCSGLGLATARDLHSAGAYVSLLDLNADAGAEIVAELGPERATFFETDVSDTESVKAAVDGTAEWIGKTGKSMGGVVAAAGVGSAEKVRYEYCEEDGADGCVDYRWEDWGAYCY